ncbi:MAG: Stk1 family PASTA domain-containing Ser/Thr kinase [Coriobacteriaceae bacterium]|nr:Stk1 family PASTA domain-containing Ser/Thr kinase [Coriobacteriaceae bacterium]
MEEQHVLGGRYLLKDRVGAGGMATVYRAQDQVLDRTVAVKMMLPQYAGDATFAARFKQEAQAAAGLSSPYIVNVYDWGKDGDTYYIVMEYLRGTDLKSGVRSHGALDPKKVAQIGSQICGALSVAHKHEIIHRDIKPQNIMVLPDGNIKVMDFGIARAKNSHLTQDNNVLGTAHYVSPEQTRGQELGPTSDIYSLGVVMYECATGQVPFDGDDAISVAMKQVSEAPMPPSKVNPGVDTALERIILKCMEKDPANRFQSADELREVLNAYIAGRTVDVPEPTRVIPAATATRVMSDQTQAMVRPSAPGQTTARASVPGAYQAEPEKEREGSGKGKVAAIVIGIIAVLAIATFAVTNLFAGTGGVNVPNVMGMVQEQAVKQLEDAGFDTKVEEQYSTDEDKGNVIDQTPKGGQTAEKGSTVTIVVSQGAEPVKTVKVPDLDGMTESEAEAALKAVNLVGKATEEENDEVEEGTVFWQGKDAGSEVDEGTEIEYKVAKAAETVNVPGVLGKSFSEASNELSSAGFKVVDGGSDYSSDYAAGKVMSQSVTGSAKKGTEVTLVVSKGAKKETVNVDALGLEGMTQEQAQRALANAGLRYYVSSNEASSSVPRGSVISYAPTGEQEAGATIALVISTGSGTGGAADTEN